VAATAGQSQRLAALQEALYAEGSTGTSNRRLLVVLQGMDTCGKDGTIEHVFGLLNPQGCLLTAFRAPTRQELAHHFLWRIRRRVPPPGYIGIFNRPALAARLQD
jgi:polyphosphate kinase 2 (PPK2 family)